MKNIIYLILAFLFFNNSLFAECFNLNTQITKEMLKSKYLIKQNEDILKDLQIGLNILNDNNKTINNCEAIIIINSDKNKQRLTIAQNLDGILTPIISYKISSGKYQKQEDPEYHLSPKGIFEHTLNNFGYRAEGTLNDKGIMGLGKKDMRVWDFGWQKALRPKDNTINDIRFSMHATDPFQLEQNLGKPASKGCIRIPTVLNQFIDKYKILDYYYLSNFNNKVKALIKDDKYKDIAGKYLIVI